MSNTHRIVAAMTDGSYVLLASGQNWPTAIDRWTALDDRRRAGQLPEVRFFVVREDADPDPRWANASGSPETDRIANKVFRSKHGNGSCNLGRAIVKVLGWESRSGGWVYNSKGEPITQGFASVANSYGARYDAEAGGWRIGI